MRKKGIVYLVGAGPGDPELITLKGIKCLQKADIVIYDYLSIDKLLSYAPENAEKIYVGKRGSDHTLEQDQINSLLIKKAEEGKTIVRLKGGDPFVFGRGGEECETLAGAGIPFEIVPGISSGMAAPAYAGIPITHRKAASSVAFVTGHEDPNRSNSRIHWEHLAKGVDTLIFYMGVKNLPEIVNQLLKNGRSPETPVALIRWGTRNIQETVTGDLSNIIQIVEKENLKPPAITVVGDVVRYREQLQWFENKPLFGKRIINTRTRKQASKLTDLLRELGAEVEELPTIEISPVNNTLMQETNRIQEYDWIIFTSPNGVNAFFDIFFDSHDDIRALEGIRFASIGPGTTNEIEKYHLHVDVTAKDSLAEGLLDSLQGITDWKGRKTLLPRAKIARDILPEALKEWGADVDVVPVYETIIPENVNPRTIDELKMDEYDLITFSSSSTFKHFVKLLGEEEFNIIKTKLRAVSIGPVTTKEMIGYGVKPVIEAKKHSIPGLVDAIQNYLKEN